MKNPESSSAPTQVTIDVAALLRRKAEIADERVPHHEELARLDEEERQLDLVIGIARNGRFTVGAPLSAPMGHLPKGKGKKDPRVTHRVIALLALEHFPEGAPVGYVVNWGRKVNMSDKLMQRTSVSPLLKKMSDPKRNMMEVEHDKTGRRWMITDRGRATAAAFRRQWVEAGRQPFWDERLPTNEGGE